jgi:hypothetical protein
MRWLHYVLMALWRLYPKHHALRLSKALLVMTGHFIVYVGAQAYLDDPVEATPTLVVDADVAKLNEAIERHFGAAHQSFKIVETVLAATNDSMLDWYLYNDSRLNGPLPLDAWKMVYPNAMIAGHLQRSARTLHSLLDEWQQQVGDLPEYGKIIFSQGDYLQALDGLHDWLARISEISIGGPSAAQIWPPRLRAWMMAEGFSSDHEGLHWQRDQLAAVRRENEQLKAKINRAQDQIDAMLAIISAYQAT